MRILIVKLSSLGDILHVLPTVHALHEQQGVEIDWVTQPEYVSLVRCFPDIRRVFSFPRHRFFDGGVSSVRALRETRYDRVLDLQGLLKSALVGRMARAEQRIGPSFHREGSRWLYDAVAGPSRRDRHAVHQAMDVLDFLGIPRPASPEFPICAPREKLRLPHPIIAMAPFSRWKTKNWPLRYYRTLACMLQQRMNVGVVFIGGATEASALDCLAAQCPGKPLNLAGKSDVARLAGILDAVDVLVANDSGPVHLAAALGKPCVVMYGATRPLRTAPWGAQHRILQTKADCSGCIRRHCPKGQECMSDISPEMAFAAIQTLLNSRRYAR